MCNNIIFVILLHISINDNDVVSWTLGIMQCIILEIPATNCIVGMSITCPIGTHTLLKYVVLYLSSFSVLSISFISQNITSTFVLLDLIWSKPAFNTDFTRIKPVQVREYQWNNDALSHLYVVGGYSGAALFHLGPATAERLQYGEQSCPLM